MSDPVTKIATLTPSGTATTSFTSIPSTYDDLVIIGTSKNAYTATASYTLNRLQLTVNGDTGSNYAWSRIGARSGELSYGSAEGSATTNSMFVYANSTSHSSYNNFGWGNFVLYFSGYKVTNAMKKMQVTHGYGNTAGESHMSGTGQGTWASNAAITSITLQSGNGNNDRYYVAGTTMTLYGISNS